MSGADTVAFSNHEGFVQLVKLLRSLGVIELVGKNVVEIKQPEILDGLGFATFIATVAAARWRRELFVFVPYGDKTLLALAETTARARFPVTSSCHRSKISLSRGFGGRVPPPPLTQSGVASVMFAPSRDHAISSRSV